MNILKQINSDRILSIVKDSIQPWRRVNDFPCVHTFHKKFYINLCLYEDRDGKWVVAVNVDDVANNKSDIVSEDFKEGTSQYETWRSVYDKAIAAATSQQTVNQAEV